MLKKHLLLLSLLKTVFFAKKRISKVQKVQKNSIYLL